MATPAPDERGLARRTQKAAKRRADAAVEWLSYLQEHSEPVGLGMGIYTRDREAAGSVLGSALAFRMFLFSVPLVLFVVGVMGVLSRWITLSDYDEVVGISSALSDEISTALSQASSARWLAIVLGLLGMATAGYSLARVLTAASALAWRLPIREQKVTVRVIYIVVGLMFCMTTCSAVAGRIRVASGVALGSLSLAAAFGVYLVGWLLLCSVLPRATRDPGAALPAAALVAATLVLLQWLTQFFLAARLSKASSLYGSIGFAVVTLGWFFIVGRIAMYGFTINAVVYEHYGSLSQFVFGLPLLRRLPKRWPAIARFFQLDGQEQRSEEASSDGTENLRGA